MRGLPRDGTKRPAAVSGLATPKHIRWSFANRYPWLEPAFARAYADEHRPDNPAEDQIAAIVAQSGRFAALCERYGRFRSLIDRDALMQEVVKRA